jgi:hypothetical protein
MGKIVELLKGKKTYIIAAGAAVTIFAHGAGFVDGPTATTLLGLMGAGGFASIGAKIDRKP